MEPSRYARVEDEARYVVTALPAGCVAPREIEDRYVSGTRLRLRTVRDGTTTVRKLGQKVRVDPDRPSPVWHTTIYLDEDEFAVLATASASTVRKRRWSLDDAAADEFLDDLAGLVLVEGPRGIRAPDGGVDVTGDERFSGGALAALDGAGARAIVATARSLVA